MIHASEKRKIRAAISAVGVVGSDDGGEDWKFMNKGLSAGFLPKTYPEYGQCVHKIDFHPSRPDTLYLQNHGGVYKSEDFGKKWTGIDEGLPSNFGFPIAVSRTDPDRAYVVPLDGAGRFAPGARFQVWATRNGGQKWTQSEKGLPQRAYFGVLREAMTVDNEEPGGVYCGTTTGQIFYTRDEGRSWEKMVDGLPRITSLSTVLAN
ncbi:MAG: hypothetical protein JRN09_04430 [Nitrososphaerota archaeon]|nr:hypothetical protein [Nitrososphaerota archaeon]